MRRLPVLVSLACAVVALVAVRGDEPAAAPAPPRDPELVKLLAAGGQRYAGHVRSELQSLEERRRARDAAGAAIHANRVAPALAVAGRSGLASPGGADRVARAVARHPRAAVRAAARVLSDAARRVRATPLVALESRVAGAALAFDGVRDALWDRDKGLTGSIDERLNTVRTELNRHRRGSGFTASGRLPIADARRLAAALDAYAWRLSLAADRVGTRG